MITCELNDENTVELDVQGDITAADYKSLTPILENFLKEKNKIKFLIVLDRVKSFSLGAVFEDLKFDFKNMKHIGAIAVVGSKKGQEILTKVSDVILPQKIEFFEETNLKGARDWLKTAA